MDNDSRHWTNEEEDQEEGLINSIKAGLFLSLNIKCVGSKSRLAPRHTCGRFLLRSWETRALRATIVCR
jgi:hypothetical protein